MTVHERTLYLAALAAMTAALGYLVFRIVQPFLVPLAWAAVLAALFYPMHAFALRYMKKRTPTALLSTAVILMLIIGPVTALSVLLAAELKTLAETVRADKLQILSGLPARAEIEAWLERVGAFLAGGGIDWNRAVADGLVQFGQETAARITRGIRDILGAVLDLAVTAFSTFFLLRDGPAVLEKARDILPLEQPIKANIEGQMRDVIVATLYGGVVVAMVQGTLGGLVFWGLDIASPVLWGFAMAVVSFLPVIGPFVIWGPAALYLLLTGEVLKGVVLLAAGGLGISAIDNVLRPLIMGKRARMPYFPLLISVLGGIHLFGLIGLVLGPMALAVFASVLETLKSLRQAELESYVKPR
ncbi:MAG TPA: AI-2E family transporter [Syntrophales bacterium]|nr:AI-2E family transporter [Syntrophobacterales bacterium]HQL90420.1 AI-2E family transporter [Syntrophales bacterium]